MEQGFTILVHVCVDVSKSICQGAVPVDSPQAVFGSLVSLI